MTGFFHEATSSIAYVCADPATRRYAAIDPVLDFDHNARTTFTDFADRMLGFLRERAAGGVDPRHPPARGPLLGCTLPGEARRTDGERSCVVTVQRIWKKIYNLPEFPANGSQWDRLFEDGERFHVGGIEAEVLFTPGHTAACITHRIGGRGLRARHAVHARRRHGVRRLPRRRRARAVAVQPPPAGPTAGDADLYGAR